MSVHLAEVALEEGLSPDDLLGARTTFGMVALDSAKVTADAQTIIPDPLPDDPTHANVMGNKTGGIRRRWAKSAVVLIEPPPD